MAYDAGKGAKPRPYSIPQEEYVERLGTIFEKKHETEVPKCPLCGNNMNTQEYWRFFYCNSTSCLGNIRKS